MCANYHYFSLFNIYFEVHRNDKVSHNQLLDRNDFHSNALLKSLFVNYSARGPTRFQTCQQSQIHHFVALLSGILPDQCDQLTLIVPPTVFCAKVSSLKEAQTMVSDFSVLFFFNEVGKSGIWQIKFSRLLEAILVFLFIELKPQLNIGIPPHYSLLVKHKLGALAR